MAPGIVVNEAQSAPQPNPGKVNAYKEAFILGPSGYKEENELNGTGNFKAASYPKYLPTWDNEKDLPGKK